MEENNLAISSSSDFVYCLSDGFRWIVGRGKNFEDLEATIFDPDAIGKGAAGIDGDAQRRRLLVSRGSQAVLRKFGKADFTGSAEEAGQQRRKETARQK